MNQQGAAGKLVTSRNIKIAVLVSNFFILPLGFQLWPLGRYE